MREQILFGLRQLGEIDRQRLFILMLSRHSSATRAAEIHFTGLRLLCDRIRERFEGDDDFAALDFDPAWTARALREDDLVRRAAAAGVSPVPFAPATMACSASEGIPSRLSSFLRSIIC